MPKMPSNCSKMQTKLSAWTPLNHADTNIKVFEERRSLLAKWFSRWSDSQRRAVLQDFVQSCSMEQLRFLSVAVSRRLPLQAADFTCLLPRALSLYLFSFLDPRSLCRCAQVSWRWKSIVELDQLWMPKCVKLGWCISFSPTPFEQGVWKRHYIQTVQDLRLTPLQSSSSQQQFMIPDVTITNSTDVDLSEPALISDQRPSSSIQKSAAGRFRTGAMKEKQPMARPPWRNSDLRPKDTMRFNYLDNMEPIEQTLRVQMKHNTSTPDDGSSKKTLSEMNYKLRKAKSLMFLSSNSRPPPPPLPLPPQTRPQWASHSSDLLVTDETIMTLLRQTRSNAGIRPRPVRSAVPRLSVEALRASQRSCRSSPSASLFKVQPFRSSPSHTQ